MQIVSSLLLLSFLVEISVSVTKSVIFQPVITFILNITTRFTKLNDYLTYLLFCGYCKSFWVSLIWSVIFWYFDELPQLVNYNPLNLFVIILVSQRISNILHFIIDNIDLKKKIDYNRTSRED